MCRPKSPPYHIGVSNFRPFCAAPKPISLLSQLECPALLYPGCLARSSSSLVSHYFPRPLEDSQPRTRVERLCGAVTTVHVLVIPGLTRLHVFLLFHAPSGSQPRGAAQPYCLLDAFLTLQGYEGTPKSPHLDVLISRHTLGTLTAPAG